MMLITRKDPFTGVVNEMTLDITRKQLDRWEKGGELIQNVFPTLSPDEREFLMTGITPDSWDEHLGNDQE